MVAHRTTPPPAPAPANRSRRCPSSANISSRSLIAFRLPRQPPEFLETAGLLTPFRVRRGKTPACKKGEVAMAKVRAIPEGYFQLTPFFNVKGADRAIEFYKKAFGAEERAVMKAPDGTVMHAELKIGDSILMMS